MVTFSVVIMLRSYRGTSPTLISEFIRNPVTSSACFNYSYWLMNWSCWEGFNWRTMENNSSLFLPLQSWSFLCKDISMQSIKSFIQKFPCASIHVYITIWVICLHIQNVLHNTIPEMQIGFHVLLKKEGLGIWTSSWETSAGELRKKVFVQ
jgi:hypothetical protein